LVGFEFDEAIFQKKHELIKNPEYEEKGKQRDH